MRLWLVHLVLVSALVTAGIAHAEPIRLGMITPLEGSIRILGEQMRNGIQTAAGDTNVEIVPSYDGCSEESGEATARSLIEAQIDIAVGYLCTETLRTALDLLSPANIPVITPAVRTDAITDQRERNGWMVYRTAPRASDEQEAIASILPQLWREELFAIVDDGTIYGRELAEAFRFAAENAGLEPVFIDTYRPQLDNQIGVVGRLNRAGATHVFAGGDREDIAIMARDAAELGYDMVFAGGEALRTTFGETPLSDGVLMIGLPEWADDAAPEVIEALAERGIVADGYVIPGYVAAEIAIAAINASRNDDVTITEALDRRDFYTALGLIRFDEQGDVAGNFYRLFRYDGENFVPVDTGDGGTQQQSFDNGSQR